MHSLDVFLLLDCSLHRLTLLDNLFTLARLGLQVEASLFLFVQDLVVLLLGLFEPLLVLVLLLTDFFELLARFAFGLRGVRS